MAISENKMQIVIDNYFKSECNVDTSIRGAFEKGFRIGVQKTIDRPHGEWIERHAIINQITFFGENRCSNCGKRSFIKSDFCPNCGADMRGGA